MAVNLRSPNPGMELILDPRGQRSRSHGSLSHSGCPVSFPLPTWKWRCVYSDDRVTYAGLISAHSVCQLCRLPRTGLSPARTQQSACGTSASVSQPRWSQGRTQDVLTTGLTRGDGKCMENDTDYRWWTCKRCLHCFSPGPVVSPVPLFGRSLLVLHFLPPSPSFAVPPLKEKAAPLQMRVKTYNESSAINKPR